MNLAIPRKPLSDVPYNQLEGTDPEKMLEVFKFDMEQLFTHSDEVGGCNCQLTLSILPCLCSILIISSIKEYPVNSC